jgi:hypothetical protein
MWLGSSRNHDLAPSRVVGRHVQHTVLRSVVGHDHEVDRVLEMEVEVVPDDAGLVANQEQEPHRSLRYPGRGDDPLGEEGVPEQEAVHGRLRDAERH